MKKVVIVEDNQVIQHMFKSWFANDEFNVQFLDNIDNLVEKIEEIKPDLIVTDIMLPDSTAADLITTYSKVKYPVIVLSSMDEEDVEFFAEKIGAIKSFTKPVNMPEIYGFINDYFLHVEN